MVEKHLFLKKLLTRFSSEFSTALAFDHPKKSLIYQGFPQFPQSFPQSMRGFPHTNFLLIFFQAKGKITKNEFLFLEIHRKKRPSGELFP